MLLRGTVYSKTLGMDTSISVLTPKERVLGKPTKVVYLLHGLGGNHDSWVTNTLLPVYGNKYQVVVVMPEVQRSFYANQEHGLAYFSYIAEELPEMINQTFNISAKREDTMIAGASMGGYGALKVGLSYPERFGKLLSFSGAPLFIKEELINGSAFSVAKEKALRSDERLSSDFYNSFGTELATYEGMTELVEMAKGIDLALRPKLYVSCGLNDQLLTDNRRFNEALEQLNWPITYQELAGGHDWSHFNDALQKGFRWLKKN